MPKAQALSPEDISPDEARAFWARCERMPSGCLISHHGHWRNYGAVQLEHRASAAHRVAWVLTYGAVGADINVCHRCDHPACVEPRHLYLATQQENVEDAARKGYMYGFIRVPPCGCPVEYTPGDWNWRRKPVVTVHVPLLSAAA